MAATDAMVSELEKIVLDRIESDRLVLPVLPAVAMEVASKVENPNVSIGQIAAILKKDPVLSASVLRTANSAAYGPGGSETLDQALAKIGMARIETLITEASARKVFISTDARIAEACQGLWDHSVGVAMLARDLAALAPDVDGETAYIAGLLHDIGKPIFASMLLEAEKLVANKKGTKWLDADDWLAAVQRSHRRIGTAVAAKWNLPEVVQSAIRDCVEFDIADRSSPANYVRFANATCKQLGLYVGVVDEAEVGAVVMVGTAMLGMDESVVGQLALGIADRVRSNEE